MFRLVSSTFVSRLCLLMDNNMAFVPYIVSREVDIVNFLTVSRHKCLISVWTHSLGR